MQSIRDVVTIDIVCITYHPMIIFRMIFQFQIESGVAVDHITGQWGQHNGKLGGIVCIKDDGQAVVQIGSCEIFCKVGRFK